MPTPKNTVQQHIDAAGRLACIINELSDDSIYQIDVLEWCAEVNIVLANDTKTAQAALDLIDIDIAAQTPP